MKRSEIIRAMRADPALRKAVLSGVEGEEEAMDVDEEEQASDVEIVAPSAQAQKVRPLFVVHNYHPEGRRYAR